jgi:hypothetical protein
VVGDRLGVCDNDGVGVGTAVVGTTVGVRVGGGVGKWEGCTVGAGDTLSSEGGSTLASRRCGCCRSLSVLIPLPATVVLLNGLLSSIMELKFAALAAGVL